MKSLTIKIYLPPTVAVVGFEQTMYTVNESSTFQEVCVIVTNPPDTSELAIEIILAYGTVIGTAGDNMYFITNTMNLA